MRECASFCCHARAYHTPGFLPALSPVRAFFDALPMSRPEVPIYSCAVAGRMGGDVESIRRMAVEQWILPVSFRSTIEAMYADGARVFVEVGARGNLSGFIEDTLRGRPHFAIAANLPRRSGLTQLNHLVASLFAQGVALRPDFLYARRRPERVDFETDRPRPEPAPALTRTPGAVFPELRLSAPLAAALRERRTSEETKPESRPDHSPGKAGIGANGNGHAPEPLLFPFDLNGRGHRTHVPEAPARPGIRFAFPEPAPDPRRATSSGATSAAMLAYLRTMDEFLETQRQVMDAYLAGSSGPTAFNLGPGPSPVLAPPPVTPLEEAETPPTTPPAPVPVESVTEAVLERVARRTGYPRSMLQLDFDLEADLGIDSIKRVEILNELQDAGFASSGLDLERLTRSRTLRHWLEILEPEAGSRRSTPGVESSPWLGAIEAIEPGRSLVAVRRLDAADDPVAEHHTLGGRRVSAIDLTRKGLPVVPFTVMAEMLAEAAAALAPGRTVVALRDVVASKWILYEEEPVALEIRAACDPERPDEFRAEIHNKGPNKSDGPVVTGRIVFGPARLAPPPAHPLALENVRACRFDAGELYRDQWLFHGPALQAVVGVGRSSPGGIEGTLRVLPHRGLLRPGEPGAFQTDPIVLDAFTHLLGTWGLDEKADGDGDVMFPLRLGSLTIFGASPAEGTEVACRIAIREVTRHKVRADAEIVTPDGRVWMRIENWEDWRFYWPGRCRDQFRQPDRVFLGEPLDCSRADDAAPRVQAVWLEPPADMGKPVWRDVLEWVQLGPDERAACRALGGTDVRQTHRLWGRIAAKEAARRLWADRGGPPVYPADLAIEPDPHGRPRLRSLLEPARTDLPAISIAHTEGVALALAALDPNERVGIDVERVVERSPGFEELAFSEEERGLLARMEGPARAEWVARFWCAKEAVAKASGQGLNGGPRGLSVVAADTGSGELAVILGPELAGAWPERAHRPICARTAVRGEYVWAWTIGEPWVGA